MCKREVVDVDAAELGDHRLEDKLAGLNTGEFPGESRRLSERSEEPLQRPAYKVSLRRPGGKFRYQRSDWLAERMQRVDKVTSRRHQQRQPL